MCSWCLVWMIKFTCCVLIRAICAKFAIFGLLGRMFVCWWYFILSIIFVGVTSFASTSLACTIKALWAFILRLIWRFFVLNFRSIVLKWNLRFWLLRLLWMTFQASSVDIWAHQSCITKILWLIGKTWLSAICNNGRLCRCLRYLMISSASRSLKITTRTCCARILWLI